MQEIRRRTLSLLASVLFSIPLPLKFSIPRSLEIAFNQETLTAKKITDQDLPVLYMYLMQISSHLGNMKISFTKHENLTYQT